MQQREVIAVILGGGKGTRLFPLTKLRAKPAVPLGARYRLIDIPISNCINSRITGIYVLTQYLSASLHRHISDTYKFDIFSRGFVELLAAEQTLDSKEWYQGTADAVRHHMTRFKVRNPRNVLILAGDHLYRMNYARFQAAHVESDADVSVAVMPVRAEEAPRFGILKLDDQDRIADFKEKPEAEEQDGLQSDPGSRKPFLASMGIYLFKTEALEKLLDAVQGQDFGGDIIPAALQSMRVHGWRFEGYWEDIGTIGSFYKANLSLTNEQPSFSFYDPNRPIYTHPRYLPASHLDGCSIRKAVIASCCRLYDAMLDGCVIGQRSVVRSGAYLKRVVMLGADFYEDEDAKKENKQARLPNLGIGHDSRIDRAIIDKNARIGRGVTIRSQQGQPDCDGDGWYLRDGIVVIPKHGVIPDGTVI